MSAQTAGADTLPYMFDRAAECMPRNELKALQLSRLKSTLDRAYHKVPHYKKKFDADMDACKGCGICAEMCPVDDIDMVLEAEGERQDNVPGPEVKGAAVKDPDEEYGWDMIDKDGTTPHGEKPGGDET